MMDANNPPKLNPLGHAQGLDPESAKCLDCNMYVFQGDVEAHAARHRAEGVNFVLRGEPDGPTAVEQRNKGGRPRGFSGTRSKMPSALAQAFKKAGLDWKEDFALAIKHNKRERIKLWLRLLPYMITTSARARVKKWKGKPSKAAMIALETLEGR